jgi:hypothetical protein
MPIADFAKLRGLNYLPSWAASPVSQWRFYDGAQAQAELGYASSIGANAVRVWLSYAVWAVEGPAFDAKLADFLGRAHGLGLSVVLIVWDSVGSPPSASPYDDLTQWTSSPGPQKVADPAFLPQADAYVAAVVAAALASGAEVVWDAMNEPDFQPLAWLTHHLLLLQDLDPSHPRTASCFFAAACELTAHLVDVIAYHPYGLFRRNVEEPTAQAQAIAAAHGGKPLLATELGFPGGGGQRYEDVLLYITAEGVGFFLFQAMIGDNPSFPWKTGTGFFFKDGTIRDLEAVRAFQSVAKAQGVPPVQFPLENDGTGPLWIPYDPIPAGFGTPEASALLLAWDAHYGVVYPTVDQAPAFYTTFFLWTFASFWLAGILDDAGMVAPGQAIDALEAAITAADWAAAETALSGLAELAGLIVAAEGLAEPPNRPPEILKGTVGPAPFPGGVPVRIEAALWDPEGVGDVLAAVALVFKPADHYLFSVPLQHQGSGLFAFESQPLLPFPDGTVFTLVAVAVDQLGTFDFTDPPLLLPAKEPTGGGPGPAPQPPPIPW